MSDSEERTHGTDASILRHFRSLDSGWEGDWYV